MNEILISRIIVAVIAIIIISCYYFAAKMIYRLYKRNKGK